MGLIGRRYTAAMPSRPVLIGRGLVTHTHPTKNHPHTQNETVRGTANPRNNDTRTAASTIQNLNQQTHHPPQPTRGNTNGKHVARCPGQHNNGSPRYGGHSGQETPGPIPNPEVKPASANGTAPDRMWESRTPPNILSFRGHREVAPECISGALHEGSFDSLE